MLALGKTKRARVYDKWGNPWRQQKLKKIERDGGRKEGGPEHDDRIGANYFVS